MIAVSTSLITALSVTVACVAVAVDVVLIAELLLAVAFVLKVELLGLVMVVIQTMDASLNAASEILDTSVTLGQLCAPLSIWILNCICDLLVDALICFCICCFYLHFLNHVKYWIIASNQEGQLSNSLRFFNTLPNNLFLNWWSLKPFCLQK